MIRHIVFDIGNVLLRWDPERPYRWLIPDAEKRARFLAEVCNAKWLETVDRGGLWEDAEREAIARFPDEAEMIRAFRRNWHEMAPYSLGETVVILEALLEAKWDVTALTNFPTDTFAECLTRFELLGTFRGVTVSGHVGLIKPEVAIYRHHALAFGLDPKATLFFDDMPANVAAAREADWNAERFVDAATMRADLKRYGVMR